MIPAFLVSRFGPIWSKVIFFGGIALALLLVVGTIYLTGRSDGKSGEVVKEQARTIETQTKVGKANEAAAGTRVEDAKRTEQQKQELSNALADATSPDDLRRRRGCAILRQQGRDPATIPACR